MYKNADYSRLVAFALGLSLIGIAFVLPLVAYSPAISIEFSWRKPLVGSLLAMICLAGISAVFFPEKCSKTIHRTKKEEASKCEVEDFSPYGVAVNFRGHHPDCGNFAAHTILVRGRILCAACTGLFLGALFVMAGTVLYFFIGWQFLERLNLWIILLGQVGVTLGLFQFKFRSYARSTLNTFFVVACFLILAGVDGLTKNVFFDLYVVGLIVFWLFTRILTSQWDHLRICRKCSLPCELRQ